MPLKKKPFELVPLDVTRQPNPHRKPLTGSLGPVFAEETVIESGGQLKEGIQPSTQQQEAFGAIAGWYRAFKLGRGPQIFTLFGYAGTGKTTLAKYLPGLLEARAIYVAFTGKATNVLRFKGCNPAGTLHSFMYKPHGKDKETKDLMWKWQEDSELAYCDLIILDESSMINEFIAMDLERYGKPILILGDPAQLPPVFGEGYYMMNSPDVMLTEIHRQALDSPVLELATRVREGEKLRRDDIRKVSIDDALAADQVLCWTNRKRWSLIRNMRAKLGRPEGIPVEGDKIMCLRNNRELGVFNGQQFTVLPGNGFDNMTRDGCTVLSLKDDEGNTRHLAVHEEGFQGLAEQKEAEKHRLGLLGDTMLATFANAITVHKSQGSEWPSVLLMNDWLDISDVDERRKFLYTGITRASNTIILQAPKGKE